MYVLLLAASYVTKMFTIHSHIYFSLSSTFLYTFYNVQMYTFRPIAVGGAKHHFGAQVGHSYMNNTSICAVLSCQNVAI